MSISGKQKLISIVGPIAFVLVYIILFPTIIVPLLATKLYYDIVFNTRCKPTRRCIGSDDYPEMERKEVWIPSGKNTLYGGIFVDKDNKSPKGVIVLGHGIGCGMNNYLNRVAYFTKHGYKVVSYDIAGCSKSSGKSIKGLAQSQIDMHNVVLWTSEQEEFKGLPLFVYGHSWSGYGSATMLNEDDVKDKITAVASLAGFNNCWDITYFQGKKWVGKAMILAKPWVYLLQWLKFGKRGVYNGIKGINNYGGPVLVAHSTNDPTVIFSSSIYAQKGKCTNPNAKFVLYEDKGHTLSRPIDCDRRIDESCVGKTCNWEEKGNVFVYNVDVHYEWADEKDINAIDDEFMDMVDEFYTQSMQAKQA